jgi:hypothetical protein
MYEPHGRFLSQLVDNTWPSRSWERAGLALGVNPARLKRIGSRRHAPPILLALRIRDVLGFPLSFWVGGIPDDARPERFGPLTWKDLLPREWNDRPPSWRPHGWLLRALIEDHALSLGQARRRLGAGSRSGLRHILAGKQAPNVRVGYLAWIELGFDTEWWRWRVPGHWRMAA